MPVESADIDALVAAPAAATPRDITALAVSAPADSATPHAASTAPAPTGVVGP